jgi:hypothetical protein
MNPSKLLLLPAFGIVLLTATGCPSRGRTLGVSKAKASVNFPIPWGMTAPPADWHPPTASPSPRPAAAEATPSDVRVATSTPDARPKQSGLVAVLPLSYSSTNIEKDTQLALEETIRSTAGDHLAAYGYTILTGETTLAVLADNNLTPEKACESTCALGAARELKARLFLSGTVTRSEGALIAFIRIFETDTGRQLSSVQLEGETVRSLRQAFEQKSESLVKKALEKL